MRLPSWLSRFLHLSTPPVLGLAPAASPNPRPERHSVSILSDLMSKKITFSQAASEFVSWGEKLIGSNAAASAAVAAAVSDAKQAASNAVALADTALGALLMPATIAVEAAANGAITSAIGPVAAGALTPAVDSAITNIANALKAEIDAAALAVRAKLAPTVNPS